jgi:hypothetical protein
MLSTDEIIRKLWDAQGFGNVAVWGDGTIEVISPGMETNATAENPVVVFKPIAMVTKYPMLDHALGDAELRQRIADTVRDAGMEIE